MANPTRRPRVAVCLAGAVRDWNTNWYSIERNIVRPNAAAVFVAVANDATWTRHNETALEQHVIYARSSACHVRCRSTNLAYDELEASIGDALHGAVVINASELEPARLAAWAGAAAANASLMSSPCPPAAGKGCALPSWRYWLKRWACHRLVLESPHHRRAPFDVVVTLRPDLFVFRPWRFEFNPAAAHSFWLRIEDMPAPYAFGENEVLVHNWGVHCINDQIAVSTRRTSTTLEQLVHHLHSSDSFAPCGGERCNFECLLSSYLWRVGIPRQQVDLKVGYYASPGADERYMPIRADADYPLNLRLRRKAGNPGLYRFEYLYPQVNGRPSRGGTLDPDWQRFCSAPNLPGRGGALPFARFGDGHLLSDAGSAKEAAIGGSGSLMSYFVTRKWTRKGSDGVYTPTWCGRSQMANGVWHVRPAQPLRPGCASIVDLRTPLPPCVRPSLNATVSVVAGYGRAVNDLWDITLAPMPGSRYYTSRATLSAAAPMSATAAALSWLERFPLPHAGQRSFLHWSLRALRADAPIASGLCATPRPPLRWCVPLANPGAGSTTLEEAWEQHVCHVVTGYASEAAGSSSECRTPGHYHSIRIAPQTQRTVDTFVADGYGWHVRARCYVLPVREPAAKLLSGFRWQEEADLIAVADRARGRHISTHCQNHWNAQSHRHVYFGGVCVQSLSQWLSIFRNTTHHDHLAARSHFLENVFVPKQKKKSDFTFLTSQTDFIRGLDCNHHSLHLFRTESLRRGFVRLLTAYNPQSASVYVGHANQRNDSRVVRTQFGSRLNLKRTQKHTLSAEERDFINNVMYPFDLELYKLAARQEAAWDEDAAGSTGEDEGGAVVESIVGNDADDVVELDCADDAGGAPGGGASPLSCALVTS